MRGFERMAVTLPTARRMLTRRRRRLEILQAERDTLLRLRQKDLAAAGLADRLRTLAREAHSVLVDAR